MNEAEQTFCKHCRIIRRVCAVMAFFVAIVLLEYHYDFHSYIINMITDDYDIYGHATIVDGDSIKMKGESIRLMHIDAPEKKQFCRMTKNARWDCGTSSTLALKKVINGRNVGCKRIKKGFYGRTLAVCYNHNGIDINAYMVDIGMAVPYKKDKTYSGLADDAMKNKRGLWNSEFEMPWDYRKNKRTKKHKKY